MVRHVEGGEPRPGVFGHCPGTRFRVERGSPEPLLVGHLPEPHDDAGHLQPWGELHMLGGHRR